MKRAQVFVPEGYTLDRDPRRAFAITIIPKWRTPGEKAWNRWRFTEALRKAMNEILVNGYRK